ncbi:MAG: glycosyltransferase [Vulcanimicrobiota bacterium]
MIDVIIPARNEERDIGACLESLAGTSMARLLRPVVVDNGSSDATAALARRHGAQVLAGHGSVGRARNLGIAAGRSPLVAFLDAHCQVARGWPGGLLARLESSQAGAVGGPIEWRYLGASPPSTDELSWLRSPFAWLKTGNALFRRQVLDELRGFDESLPACEDVELCWRALLAGWPLALTDQDPVIHLDRRGRVGMLARFFRYGRGAARVGRRFGFGVGGGGFDPYALAYRLGAFWDRWSGPRVAVWQPLKRPPLPRTDLKPADDLACWYSQADTLWLATRQRRLEVGRQGALMWRCLTSSGDDAFEQLRARLGLEPARLQHELERFVSELVKEGFLQSLSGE